MAKRKAKRAASGKARPRSDAQIREDIMSLLLGSMLYREARASCRLDGETQCDPNDIPKPKKVRKRK